MISPSKKSMLAQSVQSTEKNDSSKSKINKLKSMSKLNEPESEEKSKSLEFNGNSPKKNPRKTPLNPKNKPLDEESPPAKLQLSSQQTVSSQSSQGSLTDTIIGVARSGRVRKAKIVFDPSDNDVASKRKSSLTLDNETKAKKRAKTIVDTKKETTLPLPKPTNRDSIALEKRRKTISLDENGCIVCARTDTKKGRFVNCIDCNARGHFTCLRTAKLISSPQEEVYWQCATCQTCAICFQIKDSYLYKCISCVNSFHLNCLTNKPATVTKKKFKCDTCVELENRKNVEHQIETSQLPAKKTSADGFAGFSQEDTTRSSSSSQTGNSQENRKTLKTNKTDSRKTSQSSSNKSNSMGNISPPLFDANDIKIEVASRTSTPSSIQENSDADTLLLTQVSAEINEMKNNSASPHELNDDNSNLNAKLECLKYDIKSVITPHESVPDVKRWDCDEVYTYFLGTTTAEYAHVFKENQIDGDALLLIKRDDVLNRFNLKLGPALRLYSHIVTLQCRNNNPILAWNEV